MASVNFCPENHSTLLQSSGGDNDRRQNRPGGAGEDGQRPGTCWLDHVWVRGTKQLLGNRLTTLQKRVSPDYGAVWPFHTGATLKPVFCLFFNLTMFYPLKDTLLAHGNPRFVFFIWKQLSATEQVCACIVYYVTCECNIYNVTFKCNTSFVTSEKATNRT